MKDKRKKRDATAFLSPRGRVPLEKHPRDVNIDDRKTRLCAGRLCARPHDFRGQNIDIFRLHQALAFVFAVQKQRKCAQKFPGTFPPDANVHPPRRLERTVRGDEIDESYEGIAPFFFSFFFFFFRGVFARRAFGAPTEFWEAMKSKDHL